MPIDTVTPGRAVDDIKTNEIIVAVNALQAALANTGLVSVAFVSMVQNTSTVNAISAGITVDIGSGYARVDFDVPFDDAGDYAAVASSSSVAGNDSGFCVISEQAADYVTFFFSADDGPTGGNVARLNIIIAWNTVL